MFTAYFPRIVLMSLLISVLGYSAFSLAAAPSDNSYLVLSYHDVLDEVADSAASGLTEVSTDNLRQQFEWLKNNHYHVVSMQQIVDAHEGKAVLPSNAILLTFDDGYRSFYDKVFPLLKHYQYPAMIALIGEWMNVPAGKTIAIGENEGIPRDNIMTWQEVNELVKSGLVEVAGHTYGLHKGIIGNPQGNTQAAAVTRIYDPKSQQYESDDAYVSRVQVDLKRNAEDIFTHTGIRPRVMVWPYGEYNRLLVETAQKNGMFMTMNLVDGKNSIDQLAEIKRLIIMENPKISDFAEIVTQLRADRVQHVAHVDLDYIYDADPERMEKNLGALLDRIAEMRIETVYLQAYADPDGDGNADALYFPNRHLPVRADLFNRVAWQLHMRSRIKVYAWMPIMAYKVARPDSWFVHEWREGKPQLSSHIYKRLSLFKPEARQIVKEIYQDLAKHCTFSGILFHDDGLLSDFEDVSPEALSAGHALADLPTDFETLHKTAEMRLKWAKFKNETIAKFTDELAEVVRDYRPVIKTARNIYALPILEPESEEWFAQSLPVFLQHYDYTAVEAMPFMEEAEHPDDWLKQLVAAVASYPNGLQKTVFELQAVDWRIKKNIPTEVFKGQLKLLEKAGAVHVGYYPDNLHENNPDLNMLKQEFALPELP